MSILFIFIVHNIISYCIHHFTVPKVKDLVYSPAKRYETIYSSISSSPPLQMPLPSPIAPDLSISGNVPVVDMKEELKKYRMFIEAKYLHSNYRSKMVKKI
jgi:hypothetical protein